jgi:hypothetical protein
MKYHSHLTNNTACEFQNINMNGYEYRQHIINNNDGGDDETAKESRRYITRERRTAGNKIK